MGDKDTDKLFGNSELLIYGEDGELKSLGMVVKDSTILESEESDCVPTKEYYSFDFKMKEEDFKTLLGHPLLEYPMILKIAESMCKDINDLIKTYGFLKRKGKLNRRERRERERKIASEIGIFRTYCKQNNIQYEIQ